MQTHVATVIVSSTKIGSESLAQRYTRFLNVQPHLYNVSEGPEKLSKHIGASFSEIDLILEFNEKPEDNMKLGDLLKSIEKNNRDANGKLVPKIRQIILCYEKVVSNALIECQTFCQKHNIPFNIIWIGLLQTRLEKRETSGYNIIDLSLSLADIPKADLVSAWVGKRASPMLIPEGLAEMVYSDRIVEEKYWYWDEKAAAAYLYLKESPGYSVFYENYSVLDANVRDMIRASFDTFSSCKTQVAEKTPCPIMDFIALGVGSAEKELRILEQIMDFYRYKNVKLGPENRIHYVPVDISFPLLQNSLRAVITRGKLQNAIVEEELEVDPVLTDFVKLHRAFLRGNSCKLIAALGLLWNVPAHVAFSAFKGNLLNEDSVLLVDIEFIGGRKDQELSSSYEGEYSKDFFFHPLELLNQASSSSDSFHVTSPWGVPLKKPYNIFSDYSLERGDVKVEVIDATEVESLIEKYGLPERVEKYLRFGTFENTKTVVILYVPKSGSSNSVVLGYSTRYDVKEFMKYIKENFEVVRQYYDNPQSLDKSVVGYFLLRHQT